MVCVPHGLRHTNITMLRRAGADLKTVSGRAGHGDIGITDELYSHFLTGGDIEAAQKLNDFFCGVKTEDKEQDKFVETLILACEMQGRTITHEQKALLRTMFSAKAV